MIIRPRARTRRRLTVITGLGTLGILVHTLLLH